MKGPAGDWLILDDVASTQSVAAESVRVGDNTGVVFAHHQNQGKGRFGRVWHSVRGDSLTFSLIFRDYTDHPKPYLVGMACALAAAGCLHCHLRWPNDLVVGKRKVGGILTELIPDSAGRRIPVVGIGVNLNQETFPEELSMIASSLKIEQGSTHDALTMGLQIVDRLSLLPEPDDWSELSPIWDLFDRTPGKHYRLPSGDLAVAIGVGSDAQLLCSVDGESHAVMAADAIFGVGG